MRTHASLERDAEINSAAWVAARGAAVGAAKWGIASAVLGGAGYIFSPIYRGLTIQFKVIVEADRRLISHEQFVRAQKRLARDAEVWRRYEEEFEELGTPGVAAESKVSNQSQQR
ncbi:hypothetical protein SLS58_005671 [Diplodia intermedia]|uniref:Imidazoleglycerol-phosphate dehydratase n=1 Tax=Diplodia intermedia TaxID=856260 RepID=A0ABR3TQ32_9PEZI